MRNTKPRLVFDQRLHVENLPEHYATAFEICQIESFAYKQARKYSPHAWTKLPRYFQYLSGSPSCFSVPRGFPVEIFGIDWSKRGAPKVVDKMVCAPVEFPEPAFDMFKSQQFVVSSLLEDEHPSKTFLLVAPTSRGKTVMALHALAQLKQRALILVHTTFILKGWIKECKEVFGLDASEIGIIKGNCFRVGDQITIAMVQTIRNRQAQWSKLFSEIGCIVCDEAHTSPTDTIAKILDSCPAKYRIGLTATETRRDGMHALLFLLFGEPYMRQSMENSDTPSSMQISDAILVQTQFCAEYGLDYTLFIDKLIADSQRNALIAKTVLEEAQKGNVCLVVTNRRKHAEILQSLLGKYMDTDIALGASDKEAMENNARVFKKFRDGHGKILVATNKLISTGANLPSLNRLFLTVPYVNVNEIVQLAGRIRRKCPGKKDAVIFDFFDSRIGRCVDIVRKYHQKAFKELQVKSWQNKNM